MNICLFTGLKENNGRVKYQPLLDQHNNCKLFVDLVVIKFDT